MERRFPVVRLAVLIALALFVVNAVREYEPNSWVNRDGRFYLNMLDTLTESHTLRQEHYAASWYRDHLGWNAELPADWSNLALGRNGEHWPKHPWLLAIVTWPLYWAFGVGGTLATTGLFFVAAYASAVAWGRRHAGAIAALGGAAVLVFAAGPRMYLYDYQLDPLILAVVLLAAAAAEAQWSRTCGVLLALAVVARPTVIIVAPALALRVFANGGWRALGRAVLGGAVVAIGAGALNTWMFGRPWWSGYNRVLVVRGGVLEIESHSDAFGVDLRDGLRRDLLDEWGLWDRDRATLVAVPGALWQLWKRPLRAYTLVALLTMVGSVLLFAKYRWTSDRFHWPALALFVPALAGTFDLVTRWIPARWMPRFVARPFELLPGTARAGFATLGALLLALLVTGGVWRTVQARAAFRLESWRALHDAEVQLGSTACDFLGWEHMAWECAALDPEVTDRSGWVLPYGTRVQHRVWPAFRIATGGDGTVRQVQWARIAADRFLAIDAAVPDGDRAGLDVSVRVDGRFVGSHAVDLAAAPAHWCIAVPADLASGERTLRIDVRGWNGRHASVALRGGFAHDCNGPH